MSISIYLDFVVHSGKEPPPYLKYFLIQKSPLLILRIANKLLKGAENLGLHLTQI